MLRPMAAGPQKRIGTILNNALALLVVSLCAVALARLHFHRTIAWDPNDHHSAPVNEPCIVRIYDVSEFLPPGAGNGGLMPTTVVTGTVAGRTLYNGEPAPIRSEVLGDLEQLVTRTVTPELWTDNGGTVAAISNGANHLIVFHTPEGHRKIERLLLAMRKADAGRPWGKPGDLTSGVDRNK